MTVIAAAIGGACAGVLGAAGVMQLYRARRTAATALGEAAPVPAGLPVGAGDAARTFPASEAHSGLPDSAPLKSMRVAY